MVFKPQFLYLLYHAVPVTPR